jgi:hypothetical protein
MFLTTQEWKAVKDKLTRAAPKLLIVLAVLVIGYWSGWYMKGADIVLDCKYANSFRFETNAFTCARKI